MPETQELPSRRSKTRPVIPIATIAIALLGGAGLYLAYEIAGTILLIFSGILLASVLDAGTRGLGHVLPLHRLVRLGIVSVGIFALIVAGLVWGGLNLVSQVRNLVEIALDQTDVIRSWLEELGFTWIGGGEESDDDALDRLWDYLPAAETLFGHAQTAFGLTTGVLSNIVIVIFLGLFFAADPAAYRDGFVKLIPVAKRARVAEVMTEAGVSLRWWLLGQLAMMAIVAVSISVMLLIVGVPNAVLLGVIAGLLNFIPFLGPILAAVPVFLAAMPEGMTTLILVMVLFTVIESIEGYLIAPMVQERAVHIPPAWSLAALVVFGALFGGIGIALATPILAVARILVLRLYVEDGLEGPRRHLISKPNGEP